MDETNIVLKNVKKGEATYSDNFQASNLLLNLFFTNEASSTVKVL